MIPGLVRPTAVDALPSQGGQAVDSRLESIELVDLSVVVVDEPRAVRRLGCQHFTHTASLTDRPSMTPRTAVYYSRDAGRLVSGTLRRQNSRWIHLMGMRVLPRGNGHRRIWHWSSVRPMNSVTRTSSGGTFYAERPQGKSSGLTYLSARHNQRGENMVLRCQDEAEAEAHRTDVPEMRR